MFLRLLTSLSVACAALALAPAAFASGGNYTFAGGTPAEQEQVTSALNASSFPWNAVPGPIVVHIGRGVASHAVPGQIWLDGNLLDAGRFSWGVVQHEYGHEVDFALLSDGARADLQTLLGDTSWWSTLGEGHSQFACEGFADLVSWAYWSSPDNVMQPQNAQAEGGQITPAAFRAELALLLPGLPSAAPQAQLVRSAAAVRRKPGRPANG